MADISTTLSQSMGDWVKPDELIETYEEDMCPRCEVRPTRINCTSTCGKKYCSVCIYDHWKALPHHASGQGDLEISEEMKLCQKVFEQFPRHQDPERFQKDEDSKWFGLHADCSNSSDEHCSKKEVSIVQTSRLKDLLEKSLNKTDSPPVQYPSFISFIGKTGSGKSQIIRSIQLLDVDGNEHGTQETPLPGASSGEGQIKSTTGEVNLYPDAASCGTEMPLFYVDCEGIGGTSPMSAQYQGNWFSEHRHGSTRYRMSENIDRTTATTNLYPRFIYLVSDVVCYVTDDKRIWCSMAKQLMEWSKIAAEKAINQRVRPVLIVVLNGIDSSEESWVKDPEALERLVFKEIGDMKDVGDNELQRQAAEHGVKSLEELLSRSFSSISFHYIPKNGSGKLGTPEIVIGQMRKLKDKVLAASIAMQALRKEKLFPLNSNQLVPFVNIVFQHLSIDIEAPFDLHSYHRYDTAIDTLEHNIYEFLKLFLQRNLPPENDITFRLDAIIELLASSALRLLLGTGRNTDQVFFESILLKTPSAIQEAYQRAFDKFIDNQVKCSYTEWNGSVECVNRSSGHAKGHQTKTGRFMRYGKFQAGFDIEGYKNAFNSKYIQLIETMKGKTDPSRFDRRDWQSVSEELHKCNVLNLRKLGTFSNPGLDKKERKSHGTPTPTVFHWKEILSVAVAGIMTANFSLGIRVGFVALAVLYGMFGNDIADDKAKKLDLYMLYGSEICFGCILGQAEYRLPCGHVVCVTCLRMIDKTKPPFRSSAGVVIEECMICGDDRTTAESRWPHTITLSPDLTHPRVLSLDGGGVRGISQLVVLKRLEELIGIGLPVGRFFDLIVGSSCGGLIAVALAIAEEGASTFLATFEDFCRKTFVKNLGTQTPGLGGIARWFHGSIYDRRKLDQNLAVMLKRQNIDIMFGLESHCRTTITTTVNDGYRLIANYRNGGIEKKRYLSSFIALDQAAQFTFAAPGYFEPLEYIDEDGQCIYWDGGLKTCNPIKIALEETKRIWGEETSPGLLLSLGSGTGSADPIGPPIPPGRPSWLQELSTLFATNLDGEGEWSDMLRSLAETEKTKFHRLNVNFHTSNAPAYDDLTRIEEMKSTASAYSPSYTSPVSLYSPVIDANEETSLDILADILRASLFFFELLSIRQLGKTSFFIRGHIRCSLRVNDEAENLEKLLNKTAAIVINGTYSKVPKTDNFTNPFKLPIDFGYEVNSEVKHENGHEDGQVPSQPVPIRIDVNFGERRCVAISGFPMSFEKLRSYAQANFLIQSSGSHSGNAAELDGFSDAEGEPSSQAS